MPRSKKYVEAVIVRIYSTGIRHEEWIRVDVVDVFATATFFLLNLVDDELNYIGMFLHIQHTGASDGRWRHQGNPCSLLVTPF